jgi:dipeptidyl-peptidase-4
VNLLANAQASGPRAVIRGLRSAAGLLLAVSFSAQSLAAELPPLALDQLFSSPSIFGTAPSPPAWSPDSSQLAFRWNDRGLAQRQLWLVSKDGSRLRQLSAAPIGEFVWLVDGSAVLSLRGAELWSTNISDGTETRLASLGEGVSDLSVSPDGQSVSYLKNGDLWLFDPGSRQSRALSDIGIGPLSTLRSPVSSRSIR